ncbi:hypothetical protein HK099_008218 [Clydaea vesicula]|uniref:BZIP domain-containing protein n=1 Tax=Clydaea vesicula TaxID=447962 RepID=A0AAD5TY34_9FUNG|nr:hypothetical protein HK099_008218 [Clydaea vesicula]
MSATEHTNQNFNFENFLNFQQEEEENVGDLSQDDSYELYIPSLNQSDITLTQSQIPSDDNILNLLPPQQADTPSPIEQLSTSSISPFIFPTMKPFFEISQSNTQPLYDWSPSTAIQPPIEQPLNGISPKDIFLSKGSDDDLMSGLESDPEVKIKVEKKCTTTKKSKKQLLNGSVDDLSDLKERSGMIEEQEDFKNEDRNLTSKERRQIRNKISARNFRLRRKEYISTLEDEVRKQRMESKYLKLELEKMSEENYKLKMSFKELKLKFFNLSLEKEEEEKSEMEMKRQAENCFSKIKPSTKLLSQVEIKVEKSDNTGANNENEMNEKNAEKKTSGLRTTSSPKTISVLKVPNPHSSLFQKQALQRKKDLDLILKKFTSTPALEKDSNVAITSNSKVIIPNMTKTSSNTSTVSNSPTRNGIKVPSRIATGSPKFSSNSSPSKSEGGWLHSRVKVHTVFIKENNVPKEILNSFNDLKQNTVCTRGVKMNKKDLKFFENLTIKEKDDVKQFKETLLKKFLFLILISLDVSIKYKY